MSATPNVALVFSKTIVEYHRAKRAGEVPDAVHRAYSWLIQNVRKSGDQPEPMAHAIASVEASPQAHGAAENLARALEIQPSTIKEALDRAMEILALLPSHDASRQVLREARLARYIQWVWEGHRGLRTHNVIPGQERPDSAPLQLQQVFVELDTTLSIPKDIRLREWLRRSARDNGRGRGDETSAREMRRVPVFEALTEHPRMVVLGNPGSGKSTVGQYLAFALAERARGNGACFDKLGMDPNQSPAIPIPIVLRHFAGSLSERAPAGAGAANFWEYLKAELHRDAVPCEVLDAVRDSGSFGYWFLLDGWDETDTPLKMAMVAEAVTGLLLAYAGQARCRFLLTSRFYAWDDVQVALKGKLDPVISREDPPLARRFQAALAGMGNACGTTYSVGRLDDQQIAQFTQRWYEAVQSGESPWLTPQEADVKRRDLEVAAQRPDLEPVVSNPLLLTLTASLSGSRLPDDRADLFNQVVDLLLDRWTRGALGQEGLMLRLGGNVPMSIVRESIEACAFEAHLGNAGKIGLVDIPEGAIRNAMETILDGDANKAKDVIDFIRDRSGVLVSQGRRSGEIQYACPHRSLQEFLAGCHLARQPTFWSSDASLDAAQDPSALVLARTNPGHWREVLAFAARRAGEEMGSSAASAVVHCSTFANHVAAGARVDPMDWSMATVAGGMLREIGLIRLRGRRPKIHLNQVVSWLAALVEHGGLGSPRERNEAAALLAHLGDPRRGVAPPWPPTVAEPMFAWTDLIGPVTAVELGNDPAAYNFGERGWKLTTPMRHPFYLAAYPVTNAQYDRFESEPFFGDEARTGVKLRLRSRKWLSLITPNHPVVNVSWHDAMAFCAWLDDWLHPTPGGPPDPARWSALGLPGSPPEGTRWRVQLPTEVQWELAARGEDRRWVPWRPRSPAEREPALVPDAELGTHCNWRFSEIGGTSAVGIFRDGQSPAGAFDMIGNVWEWTRSEAKPVPQAGTEAEDVSIRSEVPRVLRGGSWGDVGPERLRCAARSGRGPGYSRDYIGFRVAVVCLSACGG